MSRLFTTALIVFVTTSLALGDLRIRQWNPNITTGFTIEEPIRKITITSGHPTEVFKFEAYDDVTNLPETINEISVEPGAGTVLLAVIGDPAGERTLGASSLKKLDLSAASDSTLVQVKIDADLGEDAPTAAESLGAAGGLTPLLDIGGNLLNNIELTEYADGDIYINGPGPHSGNITIGGWAQAIEINNDFAGDVSVGAELVRLSIEGGFTGSIDLGAWVRFLDIGEWLSPSPAFIRVAGNAVDISLQSSCGGDIVIGGDASILAVYGDFSGSIEIHGEGSVFIQGDVIDSGDNYVRIREAPNGSFRCENMELTGAGPDEWLTFGPGGLVGADISINGELSGVLCFEAPCEANVFARTINGAPQPDPNMPYGGICFRGGSLEGCYVRIQETFRQGWIFATRGATAAGIIWVQNGNIGEGSSPAPVARILTGRAATIGNPPIDLGWIVVTGTLYPSGDGAPAIYATGDLTARLAFTRVSDGPGTEIQIDGGMRAPFPPALHVHDELEGDVRVNEDISEGLMIRVEDDFSGTLSVGGNLEGQVLIHGSVRNGAGDEIEIGGVLDPNSTAAIAVDYDGWHPNDVWEPGATVRIAGVPYYGNTPAMHLWEIQRCKGDMNNNGALDPNDPNILWHVVNDNQYDYEAEFPGLEGSLAWHGDLDCSYTIAKVDVGALAFFAGDPNNTCCLFDPECGEYQPCRVDLDRSGEVGLDDLNILLATYGKCEGDPEFNPDADFDADTCVGLADLNFLLGAYGQPCSCFDRGAEGGGEGGPAPEGMALMVEAYDTGGLVQGDFAGESEDFVFDLMIELADANDDWTASGVAVRAENGASFRLGSHPTAGDPLVSFVSAPRVADDENDDPDPDTRIAGAYRPVSPLYGYEAELINVVWFDQGESDDGPAAIMHLVIDVSEVAGADTSGGFGSVYFSESGPVQARDILVGELDSRTGTHGLGRGMFPLSGRFYVRGQ
jgi:hypothetical protein